MLHLWCISLAGKGDPRPCSSVLWKHGVTQLEAWSLFCGHWSDDLSVPDPIGDVDLLQEACRAMPVPVWGVLVLYVD